MVYKITECTDQEEMSGNIVLKISGMTCSKCEETIMGAALKCIGVKDAKVSHREGKATIKANLLKVDVNALRDVVEGTGFSVGTIRFNSAI